MLSVRQLNFNYQNSRPVLKSINLDFNTGNIYGLFGKNGEGKSTLMKIMTGLLFPKSGTCTLLGESTKERNVEALQHVFFITEDFELPSLSIATFEKVQSPFYPKFSKEQFYELIEEFKLSPISLISKLSFGQKKKVLIAFGIAANTKVLLMDEPTNGLDIPSKSQFRKVMASAVDEGKCIVISTHQVRDLHSLINHVVVLDNAHVIFDESLETVSEGLWFGKASNIEESSILYSESSFGGKTILARNEREESEVDLELLFNGVLSEPNKINTVLKSIHHGTGV
ncbi:ATP-binding cassette domain-containing protein [Flagellimonas sp. CMM7]|uniref:ABC transporter ATP-binding protein n=1 Tax=Flagellimonas sp. CMM7 TaxID=2654676 RepID=UPI0013D0D5A9|nr:ABC transporter ATP-binding protein [Flagellimonas sp. CMM7]UII79159.1 ABC transporter ATP-binding protein [Flagellimonas sp. CMM7]